MSKKESKKLFHFHLSDSMGNKKTLIATLSDGSINYSMYGGVGSSGMGFALSNIQYYKMVNGDMRWYRRNEMSLPLSNLPNESINEFNDRVKSILQNSTHKVINEVSTQVTFKE